MDGVLQTAQAQASSGNNTNNFGNNPLYLMSRAGTSEYAAGVIDDFRIYSRALSATEVQQLYWLGATPDTQPPSVPTNLTATAVSASQVNLGWTASVDNVGVAGYQVLRNGAQAGTSVGTAYADTNLAAATTYNYAVAAFDAAGNTSAPTALTLATTLPAPVPDTNPPVVAITAPTNGTLVAGLVTISANATDNVAVASGCSSRWTRPVWGRRLTAAPCPGGMEHRQSDQRRACGHGDSVGCRGQQQQRQRAGDGFQHGAIAGHGRVLDF